MNRTKSLSKPKLLFLSAAITGVLLSGCGGKLDLSKLPDETRRKMVAAFYAGVIALQTGETPSANQVAVDKLTEATKTVPEEPAAWADLAIAHLRSLETLTQADAELAKAKELAPKNARIEALLGLSEEHHTKQKEAIEHLRKATELDPTDAQIRYKLAELLGREGTGKDVLAALKETLKLKPHNLVVLTDTAKVAAKEGDADTIKSIVIEMKTQTASWPQAAITKLGELEKAQSNPSACIGLAGVLKNLLVASAAHKRDFVAMKLEAPIDRFISMPSPPDMPAAIDEQLKFAVSPIQGAASKSAFVRLVNLLPEVPEPTAKSFATYKASPSPESAPSVISYADGKLNIATGSKSAALSFPSAPGDKVAPEGLLITDFNYDFRLDLVMAGSVGLKFFATQADGSFTDVTDSTKLPQNVLHDAYFGAWQLDVESDGDLDILVAPLKGAPFVLRNNGDGTFTVIKPFAGITELRQFVWADLDGDGDGDVAMIDERGELHLFVNERSGRFNPWEKTNVSGPAAAVAAADINHDGQMDLAVMLVSGKIIRLSRNANGTGWETADIATFAAAPPDGSSRLLWTDLDNNGAADLIATSSSGSAAWLADGPGALKPLAAPLAGNQLTIAPTNEKGRVDLVGLDSRGEAVRLVNSGSKNYHWQVLRPRADYVVRTAKGLPTGDDRINSFGIGGEMEVRAGLLYQKVPILGASVHFGLGENASTDALRIIWPNGYPRSEFAVKADAFAISPYRLGGSCPWLFAWNGTKMELVTDCIWRSPLGLKINAADTAGVAQTEDWIKLRGDQLAEKNGEYDLRICAELWETHFFDYLALKAVDHPAGTDIWVDERFAIPPPPLAVITTGKPVPVIHAVDDRGADVTNIVNKQDGNYLDTFGRGQYQGITRDHFVEVELPELRGKGKKYLICNGWIHPTDTSINIAISQGHHDPPKGLSLEVPDGKGGWRTAKPGLGFPEGKVKTIVLDVSDLVDEKSKVQNPKSKVRIRTNLEIYWDYVGLATGVDSANNVVSSAPMASADLHHRGFSQAVQRNISSPEVPNYTSIGGESQQWLDLEGYYTRYGDVKPLLGKIDDRYVIMNAGDELSMKFKTSVPLRSDWVRDFVLVGDGWVKDGNFNTGFSRTVMPLPTHADTAYVRVPKRLEDEPAYKLHPSDWQEYHTRYVAPDEFRHVMMPQK